MSADGGYDFADAPSPGELAQFPLNDLGNAMRLIRLVGGRLEADGSVDNRGCELLYLRDRGWIAFNGRFWDLRGGDELARRWAHRVASGLVAQTPHAAISGTPWVKFVQGAGSAGSSSAMLAQAQSYLGADLADFDRDPLALNVANGVLRFSVKAGKASATFSARHVASDRMTRVAAAIYDPKAKRPLFDAFSAACQPLETMRHYLRSVLGYALTGVTNEQLFVILQGKGGDGKSTLMNAVREVAGTYAFGADIATFLDTGVKRAGEASPDLARLAGDTRLICVSEPPRGSRLASSAIKAFTGGGTITARELRQGIFEFSPIGKVVLECNGRPAINDTDDGIWRRTRILLFEHQVAKADIDRRLPEKLKAEASGILNWLVEGVLAWLTEGLVTPEPVERALEDYRLGGNPFSEWFVDRVIVDRGARTIGSDFFKDYKQWCDDQGHEKPMGQTAFGRALGDLQIIADGKNGQGKKMRRGARLRTVVDDHLSEAGAGGGSPAGDFEAFL